ncbi:hypothetical protein E4U41_000683, partial [Claviceps citrina]
AHALPTRGRHAIAVHRLKDRSLWLKVARCFAERGMVQPQPLPPQPTTTTTTGQALGKTRPEPAPPLHVRWADFWDYWGLSDAYRPVFDAIPRELLRYEGADLICDGIWNLGQQHQGLGVHDV